MVILVMDCGIDVEPRRSGVFVVLILLVVVDCNDDDMDARHWHPIWNHAAINTRTRAGRATRATRGSRNYT